jgi:hypothetical protein
MLAAASELKLGVSGRFGRERNAFPGYVLKKAELLPFHTMPSLTTNDPWADEDAVLQRYARGDNADSIAQGPALSVHDDENVDVGIWPTVPRALEPKSMVRCTISP